MSATIITYQRRVGGDEGRDTVLAAAQAGSRQQLRRLPAERRAGAGECRCRKRRGWSAQENHGQRALRRTRALAVVNYPPLSPDELALVIRQVQHRSAR